MYSSPLASARLGWGGLGCRCVYASRRRPTELVIDAFRIRESRSRIATMAQAPTGAARLVHAGIRRRRGRCDRSGTRADLAFTDDNPPTAAFADGEKGKTDKRTHARTDEAQRTSPGYTASKEQRRHEKRVVKNERRTVIIDRRALIRATARQQRNTSKNVKNIA